MNHIKSLILLSWPLLGFKRGINSYDYCYNKKEIKQHLHMHKIMWGIGSSIAHMSPVAFFFLYKEIYRLEVNLRGLEDEKETDFYNEVV